MGQGSWFAPEAARRPISVIGVILANAQKLPVSSIPRPPLFGDFFLSAL
jgi:hypothetical protein